MASEMEERLALWSKILARVIWKYADGKAEWTPEDAQNFAVGGYVRLDMPATETFTASLEFDKKAGS